MPLPPVDAFLDTLRRHHFVPLGRFEELNRLGSQFTDTQALANDLVQRGWLTPYQLDHIFRDRADDLVLGPYLLREPLGAGNRGQVFKARHLKMGRIVALRIIRQELLADGDAVQRFYQQIEQASQLAHAHVVHAYDAGPIGATHFLAMEYVEGVNLGRKVADEGPVPWQQACTYIVQAALGLQHAFERGLLHGGITPANLFVTERKDEAKPAKRWRRRRTAISTGWGTVKIMDFGQAGLSLGAEARAETPTAHDYSAPDESPDVRADLFALGCTFYFLLTGRPPYPGGARLRPGVTEWQELEFMQQLPPEVPAAVAEALRCLIALAPDDRYRTPYEAATDLATAADEPGLLATASNSAVSGPTAGSAGPSVVQQRRAAEKRRQYLLIGGGSVVLLAGLAFLYALLFSRDADLQSLRGPDTPAAAELLRLVELSRRQPDADELWSGFLALAQRYPGTPEAQEARERMLFVPSPLDRWSMSRIPDSERFVLPAWQQPKELVAVFGEHRWRQWGSAPRCLAYSSDGKLAASGGDGGLVYVWDAATGRLRALLRGHTSHVRGLAFVPRSSLLVSAGHDNLVILWDVTKAEPKRLAGHGGGVQCLAVAPDGQTIASAGDDKTIRLWDVPRRDGKDFEIKPAHDKSILAIAFTPDGRSLATAGEEGTIKIWDVAARQARLTWAAHAGAINALAFAPKDGTLASAGADKKVKLWNADGKERKSLDKHTQPVNALAFNPDGDVLASAGDDGAVRLWGPTSGAERTWLPAAPVQLRSLAFAPDDRTLLFGAVASDFSIHVWDLSRAAPAVASQGHVAPVHALAFSADVRTLVSSGQDLSLRFWDVATARQRVALVEPVRFVQTLATAPDGQAVFAATPILPQIDLWDSATGKSKAIVKIEPPGPSRLAFAPDGQALAALGSDGMVRLLDPATGKEKGAPIKAHPYIGLAFSPDGRLLVTGTAMDKEATVWDVATRKEKLALKGHEQALTAVAFALEGQTVATGSADKTVRFWDPATGKERSSLVVRHAGNPISILFMPDGHGLSADTDGQILVWRANSGGRGPVRTIQLPGSIHSCVLAPDGRHLAVGNDNGTIYVLRLAPLPIRPN